MFISNNKKSVLKLKTWQGGGLAIPDVSFYYHDATLLAMMQWWKEDSRFCWHMEQVGFKCPLSEIALLPENCCFKD